MTDFVKADPAAPQGFFACEAAGLRWLADAADGVPCAQVVRVDDRALTLERLASAAPTAAAAREFGGRLAHTHDAGAPAFGLPPQGWDGPGFFGPLHQPLPMAYRAERSWGLFYAHARLAPMIELAAPQLDGDVLETLDTVMTRCARGDFDDDEPASRIHGDLWSGNVMWTPSGAVLIDPAAHGGHRETDLSMLALFGCPHRDAVLAGYQEAHPLQPGWASRIGLHQLYALLAHVVLFGGSYARPTRAAARDAAAAG